MNKSVLFCLIIVQIVLSSCRSARTIIVPEHHNDTVREVISRRDSVWLHDSVFVSERGDTIRIERWRTKYVERTVRDTMYRSRRDSVRVPVEVPVVREVERELTLWQKLRLWLGNIMLGAVGVAAVYVIVRRRLWR